MKIEGCIHSEKGFYVGDICYAMPDDLYYGYFGDKLGWKDGVHYIPDRDAYFAVAGTAWGDGCYLDTAGREYAVDAGIIGVLPLELVDLEMFGDGGAQIFEFPGTCTFKAEDGVFEISIPELGLIKIDTNDGDCEDDDYFYDDEDDEEYEEDDYDEDYSE